MGVKVVLLVLVTVLVATSVLTADARLDLSLLLGSMGIQTHTFVPEGVGACCNLCFCTRSIPPQCRCADVKTSCHSACQSCLCTRSMPPQCHCTDITSFCYQPCTGEDVHKIMI